MAGERRRPVGAETGKLILALEGDPRYEGRPPGHIQALAADLRDNAGFTEERYRAVSQAAGAHPFVAEKLAARPGESVVAPVPEAREEPNFFSLLLSFLGAKRAEVLFILGCLGITASLYLLSR